MNQKQIPLEISARHIHLSENDLESLFGAGYQLKIHKQLSQPGMFAAKEKVDIFYRPAQGEQQKIQGVRIVGPVREYTQFELSLSDAWSIKAKPPIKISGDLEGSLDFAILGPKGRVEKTQGMIIAKRHLHLNPKQAEAFGVQNGQQIKIIGGRGQVRELTFDQVEVRISENYELSCHIDTDEGNACGLISCGYGQFVT
ncbi:MAG: phosphate propanoyltransferase [Candidatus Moranbacteria bacterium]|nr:phosphate propanoyltransferase [Candidatus Moranbacteria bacterium]